MRSVLFFLVTLLSFTASPQSKDEDCSIYKVILDSLRGSKDALYVYDNIYPLDKPWVNLISTDLTGKQLPERSFKKGIFSDMKLMDCSLINPVVVTDSVYLSRSDSNKIKTPLLRFSAVFYDKSGKKAFLYARTREYYTIVGYFIFIVKKKKGNWSLQKMSFITDR
jgi:hypothetical protein